jgi:hypothetical protein
MNESQYGGGIHWSNRKGLLIEMKKENRINNNLKF